MTCAQANGWQVHQLDGMRPDELEAIAGVWVATGRAPSFESWQSEEHP